MIKFKKSIQTAILISVYSLFFQKIFTTIHGVQCFNSTVLLEMLVNLYFLCDLHLFQPQVNKICGDIFLFAVHIDIDECQHNFGNCNCELSIPQEAGCFSQCNNTMGSYHCLCTQGYVLQPDQLTCQGTKQQHINLYIIAHQYSTADHDECVLTDHGCEHECVNTYGTYVCICNQGYRLDHDMRGCSGMQNFYMYPCKTAKL